MAPVQEQYVHFTHPGHTLTELNTDTKYICDGCKVIGSGSRFSCRPCGFDLHDYCAKSPLTLSSYMDPHELTLVDNMKNHLCNVCRNPVEGFLYRCKACDFDVHPCCTLWPQYIDLAIDSKHYLRLQSSTPRQCNVCGDTCTQMRYSCRECDVDVHTWCTSGWKPRPVSTNTAQTSASDQSGGGGGGGGFVSVLKAGIKIIGFVTNVTTGVDISPLADFLG